MARFVSERLAELLLHSLGGLAHCIRDADDQLRASAVPSERSGHHRRSRTLTLTLTLTLPLTLILTLALTLNPNPTQSRQHRDRRPPQCAPRERGVRGRLALRARHDQPRHHEQQERHHEIRSRHEQEQQGLRRRLQHHER